jgi:hypothetical protein
VLFARFQRLVFNNLRRSGTFLRKTWFHPTKGAYRKNSLRISFSNPTVAPSYWCRYPRRLTTWSDKLLVPWNKPFKTVRHARRWGSIYSKKTATIPWNTSDTDSGNVNLEGNMETKTKRHIRNVIFKSLGSAEVAGCCRRMTHRKTPNMYGTNLEQTTKRESGLRICSCLPDCRQSYPSKRR